ncbi:uncharacterized protein LOC122521640 [Polistes fuscatus]|uniref:uncharacterized protein LOC122521640 n=1 Tax=Polistes fuscatus TaxID=30207 RepID=UPI001CAA1827|nr:uncharacterized protein LOC122521640 [Polistes fuscatus]
MDPIKRLGRERKALKIRLTGPEEEEFNDLDILLDRYYAIGTKINARGTKIDESGTKIDASETDADRTIDVPKIDVPKFDGDINKWISYKNSFLTLIDSRTDITDIEKLLYLRDSLVGTPLERLEMYDLIAENYKVSWNVLLDTYDRKRVILAQSFDALINTPKQENSSFEGLTRLLDNARARINIIDSFDMSAQALKVRLVERTLPDVIREEWDKRLNPDVYPTIEQLFEFLEETILRLAASKGSSSSTETEFSGKRKRHDSRTPSSRHQRSSHKARKRPTNMAPKCILCRKYNHFLYQCPQFEHMSIPCRWETIKNLKLCQNCLRKHEGPCRSSYCLICEKRHYKLKNAFP